MSHGWSFATFACPERIPGLHPEQIPYYELWYFRESNENSVGTTHGIVGKETNFIHTHSSTCRSLNFTAFRKPREWDEGMVLVIFHEIYDSTLHPSISTDRAPRVCRLVPSYYAIRPRLGIKFRGGSKLRSEFNYCHLGFTLISVSHIPSTLPWNRTTQC